MNKMYFIADLLLPDKLDGKNALPVFVQHPSNSYAMRGRQATLTCRVAHADSVNFVCNDQEMTKAEEIRNIIDEKTGVPLIQLTLEIRKGDLREFHKDQMGVEFACHCRAKSSQGKVLESEEAVVREAGELVNAVAVLSSSRVKKGVELRRRTVVNKSSRFIRIFICRILV